MEDIIHLLPDSVANQIAAGEVVQRPSSIVKEMVENSIDAGAMSVKVLVVDGGKTSVQVVDDGKGMSETDARMCFERHATSKIREANDLFKLCTMGFRGEALASIAAVAHVDLTTRRQDDELGTLIHIEGSKIMTQEPVACAAGTNFVVRNLFYNVPARRKFLKSTQTELSSVIQDFERIVLVNPDIAFSLFNNGTEMYHLPSSTVRQRISDVFGKKINAELLPVEVETSLVTISGYVSRPDSAKKRGTKEFFFVNGRFMKHPYFHSAVMKAFDNLIPVGERVSYFIYMSVDSSSIDVNVHPTKTEIKFDEEQSIWQVLYATVKETLGKYCNVPMIDFDVDGKPDIPVYRSSNAAPSMYTPPKSAQTTYNPFRENRERDVTSARNWESLYDGVGGLDDLQTLEPSSHNDQAVLTGLEASSMNANVIPDATSSFIDDICDDTKFDEGIIADSAPRFQYLGRYIVTTSSAGLLLVDQHRAHVRVLFEQNMRCMREHGRPVQKMLFPEIVQFSQEEGVAVEDIIGDLSALGFDISNLGNAAYSVNGIPSEVIGVNIDNLLHELVASAMEKGVNLRSEAREAMALAVSRASAISYGQVLSDMEMGNLLKELFSSTSPALTPDGKVVYRIIEKNNIENMF